MTTTPRQKIANAVANYQISVGLDFEAAWEDANGIADAILAAGIAPTPDAEARAFTLALQLAAIFYPGSAETGDFDGIASLDQARDELDGPVGMRLAATVDLLLAFAAEREAK